MTESETVHIDVDTPETTPEVTVDATELADAIVDAQVEAVREIQQQEDVEHAEEMAAVALESVSSHTHMEYAEVGHSHPELGERIDSIESRIVFLESQIEETETNEIETIEPVEESTPPPPTERKRGLKRGRRT